MQVTGSAEPLFVHLLGGFRVAVGPRPIHDADWRLRKTKHLIKLLALAPGHQLQREQLMDTLWPEQHPEAAANNLHKAVYTARRALEPELGAAKPSAYLHLRGDALVLESEQPVWVDVEAFEQAAASARAASDPLVYQSALDRYAGELLPEDRYEDWAAARRDALHGAYLGLLRELAALRVAAGDPRAAIDPLRQIVVNDPADEEAHVALMRTYAQVGQRHQALRQYELLRRALRRELDVDPTPASERLYQELLAGGLAPAAPVAPTPVVRDTADDPVPVGRDAELDALEDAVDALFQRQSRLLFLAGEAGIGKTRLAREIARRVRRRGGIVLMGAAYEQEGQLPYGPFAEALQPVGGLATPIGVHDVFGEAGSDLARLPDGQVSAARTERLRLFASVTDVLRRMATSAPLVLVLDDLHVADQASLELLHYVARTTRQSPVLILATFRSEETPPASMLGQLVQALRRNQLGVRLDLGRLTQPASDLLVSELIGPEPIDRTVFTAVHQLGAGNPLYVEEVLRGLRDSGRLRRRDGRWQLSGEDIPLPQPALQMLAARLERLGPVPLQVLSVAAVIGQESRYPLLRAAAELPDGALLDALDACLACEVLNETADGYRFGHPLQRAAAYERLSRARRMILHGRVAGAVEHLHAGALEEHAEVLAHHWLSSDRRGRAVPYLVRAGDRAAAVHATAAAETAYRQALDLLDEVEPAIDRAALGAGVWEKRGDLRALAGAAPDDEAAYLEAARAAERSSTVGPEALARLYRKAAYAALARYAVDAAGDHLDAAEAVLGRASGAAEWPRVRLVRALWHWARHEHEAGLEAAEESVERARARDDLLDLVSAYMTLALVFHSSGRWKEGLALEIGRLGPAADADPGLGLLFDAHMCLGEYHLYGDASFEAVAAYAGQRLEQATRVGARRAQALARLLLGESLLSQGRWNDAEAELQRSLETQRAVSSAAGQALTLQRLAELRVYRGDSHGADELLAEGLALEIDAPMAPHVTGRLYATLALSALARGDAPVAARYIEEAAEAAGRIGACTTCSALLDPVAADAYLALGDVERAYGHAQAAEQTAAYWESGAWRAMAERVHGRVLAHRGDVEAGARRLLGAAELFGSIGQRYDAARCLVDAAKTGALSAEDTRQLLERAGWAFAELGAIGAAADAHGLLAGSTVEVPEG